MLRKLSPLATKLREETNPYYCSLRADPMYCLIVAFVNSLESICFLIFECTDFDQLIRCKFCTFEAHSVMRVITRPDSSTESVVRLWLWSDEVDEQTQFLECLLPCYWCFRCLNIKTITIKVKILLSKHLNRLRIVSSQLTFVSCLPAILTHHMLCINLHCNGLNQSIRCTFCTVEAHSVLRAISRPDSSMESIVRLWPWSGKVDEQTQFIECLLPCYWCFELFDSCPNK
jgi:hypothetical protein